MGRCRIQRQMFPGELKKIPVFGQFQFPVQQTAETIEFMFFKAPR
jgi:hypothetical protein